MACSAAPLLLSLVSFTVLVSLGVAVAARTITKVPAVYIFGDSTADVGNNNFLAASKAKANYLPYGVDFIPAGPTGRFSNGLNSADFLATFLGFHGSPPPFLSLTSFTDARTGINFASAGSGIFSSTGAALYGEVLSLDRQLQHFETIRSNLTAQMGAVATGELLSSSVFLLSTGSNDVFEAFGALGSLSQTQKTALVGALVLTYKTQLKALYNLGARKIGVISIPPIGCCPSIRTLNATGGCVDALNEAAQDFFWAMEVLLKKLSCEELPKLKYALGNTFEMLINFFNDPEDFGFTEIKTACCGGGKFNGESNCLPNSTVCSNRTEVLFWDRFHPTEAASKLAARTLFTGSIKFVSPINFWQLAYTS